MREVPQPPQPAVHAWQGRRWPWVVALLALLGAILFPLEWLGERWPAFGGALGRVFADDLRHAAGHLALFVLLGLLAPGLFPGLLGRPRRYFGLLILAGVGQEALQLLFKRRSPALDDGRDLLVDLLGLALAFAAARAWRRVVERGKVRQGSQALP